MEPTRIAVGHRESDLEIYAPEGTERVPGLLVLHEMYGLRDWYREDARDLASRGYLVYLPDLYSGAPTEYCVRALLTRAGRENHGDSELNAEIHRLLDTLVRDPRCNGRLGMLGMCLTGGFVLQMAKREDMAAPVLYHHGLGVTGGGLPESESTDGIRLLQAHFARVDPFCPKARRRRLAERLGERLEAYEYDMPHGFRSLYRERPEAPLAWERTVRFFDEQLKTD